MKPISRLLFLLVLFLSSTKILLAQEATCHEKLIPAFVTDKDGIPLRTLSSTDFKLESRGIPMSIVSWKPDGRRHRVVILLDVSNSMKGPPGSGFWNVVMTFAQHAANIESDNAQFGLLLFSDRVVEVEGLSKGNYTIRNRVEEISKDPTFAKRGTEGGTSIYDALKAGFQLLENPTSADSLLVITDGGDEGSKTKPKEILNLLSGSMVRVFSILVVPEIPLGSGKVIKGDRPEEFIDFVQQSGGTVFGPIDIERAGFGSPTKSLESRRVMSEQLVQFYRGMLQNDVLTLQISSEIPKAESLRLSLSDSVMRQWKHARVFYPHEIGPCPGGGRPQGNAPAS
jgi:hypothetical protein